MPGVRLCDRVYHARCCPQPAGPDAVCNILYVVKMVGSRAGVCLEHGLGVSYTDLHENRLNILFLS